MTHIEVREKGQTIAFSFQDMMKYHGPGSPGGVAQAFKVMERALPALGFEGVSDVRVGRLVELEVEDAARMDEMCQRLLANPLIEDYEVVTTEP